MKWMTVPDERTQLSSTGKLIARQTTHHKRVFVTLPEAWVKKGTFHRFSSIRCAKATTSFVLRSPHTEERIFFNKKSCKHDVWACFRDGDGVKWFMIRARERHHQHLRSVRASHLLFASLQWAVWARRELAIAASLYPIHFHAIILICNAAAWDMSFRCARLTCSFFYGSFEKIV